MVQKFDSFMMENGCKRTSFDHCIFMKKFSNDNFIILLLYVDDILIVGYDIAKINDLKVKLSQASMMEDMGQARTILGMRITQDRRSEKLWLSQEVYVEKMLDRFNTN